MYQRQKKIDNFPWVREQNVFQKKAYFTVAYHFFALFFCFNPTKHVEQIQEKKKENEYTARQVCLHAN